MKEISRLEEYEEIKESKCSSRNLRLIPKICPPLFEFLIPGVVFNKKIFSPLKTFSSLLFLEIPRNADEVRETFSGTKREQAKEKTQGKVKHPRKKNNTKKKKNG